VNDHDAMTAINSILEQFYRSQLNSYEALNQISAISGANKVDHEESE
jgi:hypothetical protein